MGNGVRHKARRIKKGLVGGPAVLFSGLRKMFYTYVLISEKCGNRYVGCTHDLGKRLSEHNAGLCKLTKNKRPWRLIYFEKKKTEYEALKREAFFKTGDDRKALKNLLKA